MGGGEYETERDRTASFRCERDHLREHISGPGGGGGIVERFSAFFSMQEAKPHACCAVNM
jgi:hypothetical protein